MAGRRGGFSGRLGGLDGALGASGQAAGDPRLAGEVSARFVGGAERRNCWQLAEAGGEAHPYGFQHLLSRARWEVDGVRDEVRARVVATLSDDEAVLIVDETGFLKKGRRSAG